MSQGLMDQMEQFWVCRLCLCTSESLVDICKENEECVFTVEETIEELLRFKVIKMDGFPWLACLTCLEKLDDFRLFKSQCIDSKIAFEGRFPMHKSKSNKDLHEEEVLIEFEKIKNGNIKQISKEDNLYPEGMSKKEIIDGNIMEDTSDIWLHYSNIRSDFEETVKKEADEENASNEQVTDYLKNEIFIEKVVINDIKVEPWESEMSEKDPNQEVDTTQLSATEELNTESKDEGKNMQRNFFSQFEELPDIKPNFKCNTESESKDSAHNILHIGCSLKGPPFSCCDCWLVFSSVHYLIRHRKFTHGLQSDSIPNNDDGWITNSTQDTTSLSNLAIKLSSSNEELVLPIVRVQSSVNSCLMGKLEDANGGKQTFSGLGKGSDDGVNMESLENKYGCDICRKFVNSKVELQAHIRAHRAAKPFMCHFCKKCFTVKMCLKKHVRIHTGMRPYECEVCHKGFCGKRNLKMHLRIHTGERPYQCSNCSKSFPWQGALKRHEMTHTGEQPYQCPKCGRRFNVSANLKSHLKLHLQEKVMECTECEKKFISRRDFRAHMKSHTGPKPYGCGICEKWFRGGSALTRHMRIHITENPYRCQLCSKQFSVSTNLKNHMLSHTGERPFVCPECGKRFSLQGNLKKHLRIHTGDKPFGCTDCKKKFMTRAALKRHILTLCGKRECYCKYCGRNYSCKSYLKVHIEKFHPEEIRAVEKHIDECLTAVINSGLINSTLEKSKIQSGLKDG